MSTIYPLSSGPTEPLLTPNGPLLIPQPKEKSHTKIPKGRLHRNAASSKDSYSCSIVDDLAQSPASIAFQIPSKIRNTNIYHCIIDEGTSTCVMFALVWKQLGSLELAPSVSHP